MISVSTVIRGAWTEGGGGVKGEVGVNDEGSSKTATDRNFLLLWGRMCSYDLNN